ncbi:MAG TPA: tetratricopeptide repeat protein [Bacteroidota bacterium]|nr:tetratricopeptide repeat protein [Bacteroidota bacterium]
MQGKSLFILFLFASLSLSTAFAQSNNEAKKLFNEGNALLKSGDFEGAIGKYNAAIKIEKHEFYFYQRGLAEKKARKVDESIASFEEAIKLNPKFAAGYVALAGSQFGKGDYQAAIDNYEKGLKENPTLGPAKKGLAAAQAARAADQIKNGDVSGAIEMAKKAIEHDPKFDKAHIILAQAYNKDGKYDAAVKSAEEALKLIKGPKGAAYFEMGLAYRNMGNMAKAKDAFTNAKKDPAYARNADYELKMLK